MSKDSYSPNKRVRESKRDGSVVNEFMTTPKVGDTDKVRLQFKRPMPGVIILVHGVNDIGEAYATQAKGLCEGLNIRLGRDDLTPGDWDVPKACGGNRAASFQRRADAQGHNSIIPFYWGFRAVDKETYLADQDRYRDELRRRGEGDVEAPYDAYYIDGSNNPKLAYENCDNFGNWLDDNFAKNGGVFANATTNLIDMWGPGADIWPLFRVGSGAKLVVDDDLSHRMHHNPHRIYYVYAAQRLANLILRIRQNSLTKNDSITVVAHSQGTSVTILANFLVAEAHEKTADCVILNNSPYSFDAPLLEGVQSFGEQQSERARIDTFSNFCQLISKNSAGPTIPELLKNQIASSQVEKSETYLRANYGKVFNYFSPHDMTVSLWNVQGIGWKGVPDDQSPTFGNTLSQRMFLHNYPLAIQQNWIEFPEVELAIGKRATNAKIPTGARRYLNAPPLPDLGYRFKKRDDCALMSSSNWAVQSFENQQKTRSRLVQEEIVDNPFPELLTEWRALTSEELSKVEAALREEGKDWAIWQATPTPDGKKLIIFRHQSPSDRYQQASQVEVDISNHSAIVLSQQASKCVTAFDVAIGSCKSFDVRKLDGGKFWQELLRMADWRESSLEDDRQYYRTGRLPKDVKRQMNRPANIPGIVNEAKSSSAAGRSAAIWKRELDELEKRRDAIPPSQYQTHKRSLERNLRYYEKKHQREGERGAFPVVHQSKEP